MWHAFERFSKKNTTLLKPEKKILISLIVLIFIVIGLLFIIISFNERNEYFNAIIEWRTNADDLLNKIATDEQKMNDSFLKHKIDSREMIKISEENIQQYSLSILIGYILVILIIIIFIILAIVFIIMKIKNKYRIIELFKTDSN